MLAIANKTDPFWFTEFEPIAASARQTIEAVSRRFHPNDPNAWADFTLSEVLLLTERVSRDLRREALRTIPGARDITLSRALWFIDQLDRYGPITQALWRWGYGAWRLVRIPLNPVAAVGQELSRVFSDKTVDAIAFRLRAMITQEFVLAVGRAAIDLYSGRLALSEEDLRAAREQDASIAADPVAPVRIVLVGQVSAGKSSLVNALAQETRSAVGPLPTTARVAEYRLELAGRPAVSLVDMPGLEDGSDLEFLEQVERADLVVWVASATQPARDTDRKALAALRAWASAQLARRAPPIVLALTHIDELRPAGEWTSALRHRGAGEPEGALDPRRCRLGRERARPVGRRRSCRWRCRPGASPTTSMRSGPPSRCRSTRRSWCSSTACASAGKACTCASLPTSSRRPDASSSAALRDHTSTGMRRGRHADGASLSIDEGSGCFTADLRVTDYRMCRESRASKPATLKQDALGA